jgi:hypothetical protein
MKPIRVTCRTCDGTGRVDLAPTLRWTLRYLRRGAATAKELMAVELKRFGIAPSQQAFNNRLEELREYGFVGRSRERRGWRYHLTRKISAYTGLLGRRCA